MALRGLVSLGVREEETDAVLLFLGSCETTLNTYLEEFFSPSLCLAGVLWKTRAISKLAVHTSQTNSCTYSQCC